MPNKIITTLVTAAKSYDLTTLDVVKQELALTNGAKDELLKRYIASASAAAAQYCNRRFQAETVKDEIFPAQDPHPWVLSGSFEVLQLSRWPIIKLVPSSVGGGGLTENGVDLFEGVDFKVDYTTGALIRIDVAGNRTMWNALPKVVQYQAGYDPVPPEIEDAVLRMVSRRYATQGRDPNLKQESIAGVVERQWWIATGSDSGNMSPDITDLLDNYRVPVSI
ncbi:MULTISPECIES: phage head-tail connector protein [unclassified Bradyrhizobium]|uniref:phage head-tail connector protein n=1 Tax=unclassified Bradyrhizobium TaxID=2631580 RepID=UPI002916A439|nr:MULTISPECIES: phage head-tail connector protein [unclassified Bradyrhizobium]